MFVKKGSTGNQRKPCDKAKREDNFEISKGVKDLEAKGEIQGQIQAMGVIVWKMYLHPKLHNFKF